MAYTGKNIRKQIRNKKKEILALRRSYFEKLNKLRQQETSLRNKISFSDQFSIVTMGLTGNQEKKQKIEDAYEEIRQTIEKTKEERDKEISKLKKELDRLKADYRDNFDKYERSEKREKAKSRENRKTDFNHFYRRNKITIIITTISVSFFVFLIITIRIANTITNSIETGREYYINLQNNYSFDCKAEVSSSGNQIYCKERTLDGTFSNYPSVKFDSEYDITINNNNFSKRVTAYLPNSFWKVDDFDENSLASGFDKEITIKLDNTKLKTTVATAVASIHYNFTDADRALITQKHSEWVEQKRIEAEEKAAREEAERLAKEEAERKAAEEAARQQAEKEEAERKAAEEKAAKEEASRHYKLKKINDGETCPSNAELCYVYDGGYGYSSYGYGTISMRIYNNTGKDISYMSLSMSYYNAAGSKTGDCFDNTNGLKAGGTWASEAYCTAWSQGGHVGDLDISWF